MVRCRCHELGQGSRCYLELVYAQRRSFLGSTLCETPIRRCNLNESAPNIGWAAFYPHLGGANAPGEMAHIVIYPDVESLMQGAALNAQGGWRMLDDYYTSYADCGGQSAMLETIMYQPGD